MEGHFLAALGFAKTHDLWSRCSPCGQDQAQTTKDIDPEGHLIESCHMLDVTQPWLPLLDDEPLTHVPVRKARRRATPALLAANLGPESRAVCQAFLEVTSSWTLSANEALRLLGEPLSNEAERLERMHGVLGAHRSLRLIAPEPARYTELLRRPDPAFGGMSMLEVLLQKGVPGIARVRAHLLAQITR